MRTVAYFIIFGDFRFFGRLLFLLHNLKEFVKVKNKAVATIFSFYVIFFQIQMINAAEPSVTDEKEPLIFKASYLGDNVNNMAGGIKTGSCYLGMANLRLTLNMQEAGWWKGGMFHVNAANTQGASPSLELLGDVQVASNIEAGNHSYIQEFWLKQQFGRFEIVAGLQDLNVEFANSENAALFLNSSFGILPVISTNFSAPIFPLTTPGLTTKWQVTETIVLVNAMYDGSPTNFDFNPYNVKWEFNSGDGLLLVSEFQKKIAVNQLSGTYKIGAYSHFHRGNKVIPDSMQNQLFGFYFYADQKIWEQNQRNAGGFVQVGYSPSADSFNKYYLGAGVNCTGFFSRKGKDVAGVAVAHAHFTGETKNETVVELTYRYQVTKNLFVQPDMQYIVHPAGTVEMLENALAANFRFGFSF